MRQDTIQHIMVVDDEDSVRMSIAEFLEDQGYRTSSAASAEEALALLERETPDLMIVDIRLPGMDGTQLIAQTVDIKPVVAFIIHTGSSGFALPDSLKQLGLSEDNVLIKPVGDLMNIIEKIEAVLSHKESS